MEDKAFDNGDDSEYANFILYVQSNNPHCDATMNDLVQTPLDSELYVADIATVRPKLQLRGVPTLLDKTSNQVYEGRVNIVKFARSHRSLGGATKLGGLNFLGQLGLGGAGLNDAELFAIDGDPTPTSMSSNGGGGGGGGGGERRARSAAAEARTQAAVEAYQQSREQMDQRLMRRRGGAPPPRHVMQQAPLSTPLPPQGW